MSSRYDQLLKKAEQELPTFNPKEEQKQLFNAAFKILTQAGDEYESKQLDAALVHFWQFSTIITQLKRSNAKRLFPTETTKSDKLFPLVLKKIEEIKNTMIVEEQEKAKHAQVEDAFEARLKQFQQSKPMKAIERTDSDDFMMSLSDSDSESSSRPVYLQSDSDHSDSNSTIDGIPTEIISVMESERVETENALPVSASLRSLTFITQWDEEIKQQELKNEEIRKQEENKRLLAEQANSFIINNEGLSNPPTPTPAEPEKPPVLARVADSLKKIFSKSTNTSEPVAATLIQPASTVSVAPAAPESLLNNAPPKKSNRDERNYSLNSPIMPNITTLRDSMAYQSPTTFTASPTIAYSTPSFHGGDTIQNNYRNNHIYNNNNNNNNNNTSNYGSNYGSDLGTTASPPVQMIPPHQCASFALQPSGVMRLVGMDGSVMSLPPGVSLIPDHQVSSHTEVLSPDADGTYVLFDGTKLIPISETVTF